MRKGIMLLLILFLSLTCVASASAGDSLIEQQAAAMMDEPGAVQGGSTVETPSQSPNPVPLPVKTVTPSQIAEKLNMLLGDVDSAISSIIGKLAMLVLLISAVSLILGALFSSAFLTQVGKGGFLFTCLGLLIFYGRDVILALIQGVPGMFQ